MSKYKDFRESFTTKTTDINKKITDILNRLDHYYSDETTDSYKQHFSNEYSLIKNKFPNVDFVYEGRIKNKNSLKEKIHRKISQGHTGNIYDIYAKKIVVYSVDGDNDEEKLIAACREISKFLKEYEESLIFLFDKSKDYISCPKTNGYKAIHIIRQHKFKNLKPYMSEIQIRTFRMEEQQKFGAASHMLSYKPCNLFKPELCPTFLKIGKSGKTYELSPEDSLEKYKEDYDVVQEYYNNNKTQTIS